eukprot:scaffold5069_cov139-Amphora_coffeaeformis.AAC.1
MQLFSIIIFLLAFASGTTQAKKNNLRAKRKTAEQTTYRITVSEDLVLGEREGELDRPRQHISIPIVDGVEMSDFYEIDLPQHILDKYSHLADSGRLYITVTGASVDRHSMKFAEDSVVTVVEEHPNEARRKLKSIGTKTIAVLRVSMGGGPVAKREVGYTKQQIFDQMFVKDISLKNQMENCSNGALKITPGGVHDVTVPGAFTDFASPAELRNEALSLFAKQLGSNSANDRFDHVVVILPPNDTPGFVGNAGVNHWISTLNDLWGLDVMVYMHEVGHNLGLGHAVLTNNAGDYSSYMSATGWKPDLEGPAKCYNAASNTQLGWFDDRSENIDLRYTPTQSYTLAAFSEANKGNKKDPILLKVGGYSVQYNFASAFNAGTELLRNEVTVSFEGDGKTYVEKDGLVPDGAIFEANNFDGTGKTLRIAACQKISGNNQSPNAMTVAVALGQSGSPCDTQSDAVPPTTPATTTTKAPPTTPATTTTQAPPAAKPKAPPQAPPQAPPVVQAPPDQPVNSKPTCPDTSNVKVEIVRKWKPKIKTFTKSCSWVGKNAKRAQRFCKRRAMTDHEVFVKPRVRDFCVQECAIVTDACEAN